MFQEAELGFLEQEYRDLTSARIGEALSFKASFIDSKSTVYRGRYLSLSVGFYTARLLSYMRIWMKVRKGR